ncbi:ABC transporter ATP-binding protein [Rhizobium calliandrae]|uniref:ABC transporter ATP-binding protein n=1 Tax=Rhizobium calliandrae TaxID=1312182 RepID=A0ABT7KJ23_9HYPH|nr:ABC transporter ATP-binding protein [Rhizobium calliandrae]MDL2408645.1 ABC transporter ATP-binding protein [Rhizobium calliandrae]
MIPSFHDHPLLSVERLSLSHRGGRGLSAVVHDVSFDLDRGEILGIIGESGAGKSTIGNAILGLLPSGFEQVAGTIRFAGEAMETIDPNDRVWLRGRRIASIFQDHTASLDPLMSIGRQLTETIRALDPALSRKAAKARAIELLALVEISEAEGRFDAYPHQLSGGQRQRVVIAIALAGSPDIIVADEPTSALDATVQKQVLRLLRSLVVERGLSVLLVTHDMGVVAEVTDRVVVMRHGQVVEQGFTPALLDGPQQEYTRRLLAAVPRLRIGKTSAAFETDLRSDAAPVLTARNISKSFAASGIGVPFQKRAPKRVLDGIDIEMGRGAITGIVGESGSGKSTIGRIVAGLERGDGGMLAIDGRPFDVTVSAHRNGLLGRVQMIFQDPATSLNPRLTIGATLEEVCRSRADKPAGKIASGMACDMLERLGLPAGFVNRYPHQLSGGQKQRVCIGRALLAAPDIIVADEPTSALDVSVQAEIVALLRECVEQDGLSMIFISHDLAVVQELCGTVYIIKDGVIEDFGPPDLIFAHTQNPYTRSLIAARASRFTL